MKKGEVVYRSVHELTDDELAELKGNYYWELMDLNDEDSDYFTCPEDIPDDVIFEHYSGICFVEDDFFCNI